MVKCSSRWPSSFLYMIPGIKPVCQHHLELQYLKRKNTVAFWHGMLKNEVIICKQDYYYYHFLTNSKFNIRIIQGNILSWKKVQVNFLQQNFFSKFLFTDLSAINLIICHNDNSIYVFFLKRTILWYIF